MSELFVIRAGDVVVCVDDRQPNPLHPLHMKVKSRLKKGGCYRVTAVVWLYGEKGLHLQGMDHRPTDGWRAQRFRKVLPCEKGFLMQINAYQPCHQRLRTEHMD